MIVKDITDWMIEQLHEGWELNLNLEIILLLE